MIKKQSPVPVVIGVIKKKGKFLLTKRQSPKKEWNKWQFPGGGLEFGERLIEGLKREVREEVGIDIKIKQFLPVIEIVRQKDSFHGIFFVFLCQMVNEKDRIKINHEASDYAWLSKEEILKLDTLLGTKEIIEILEKGDNKSEEFFQMPVYLRDK